MWSVPPLRNVFCEAELLTKLATPSYQITSQMAKKVVRVAPFIVAPSVTPMDILSHPEAFRRLIAGEDHFHKRIQTLKSWGQEAGVKVENGRVIFHSGQDVLDTYFLHATCPWGPLELEAGGIKFSSEFNPTFKTKPQDHYFASVVTDQTGSRTSLWGHPHCWMRLYTPEGAVCSVGKGYASDSASVFTSCVDKKGNIDYGDVHEWLGQKTADGQSTIQEYKIQISAEEFERLKKQSSADINDNCIYSLIDNDCADWVLNTLEKEAIIDPIDRSKMRATLLECLTPAFINKTIDYVCHATPTIKFPGRLLIANLVMALPRALNNLIALILGQWAHKGGFKRFFTETTRFTHPYLVRKHAAEYLPKVSKGLALNKQM